MNLEMMATTAISILTPYITAGAKKAAEVAGAKVADTAGKLLLGPRTRHGTLDGTAARQELQRVSTQSVRRHV